MPVCCSAPNCRRAAEQALRAWASKAPAVQEANGDHGCQSAHPQRGPASWCTASLAASALRVVFTRVLGHERAPRRRRAPIAGLPGAGVRRCGQDCRLGPARPRWPGRERGDVPTHVRAPAARPPHSSRPATGRDRGACTRPGAVIAQPAGTWRRLGCLLAARRTCWESLAHVLRRCAGTSGGGCSALCAPRASVASLPLHNEPRRCLRAGHGAHMYATCDTCSGAAGLMLRGSPLPHALCCALQRRALLRPTKSYGLFVTKGT